MNFVFPQNVEVINIEKDYFELLGAEEFPVLPPNLRVLDCSNSALVDLLPELPNTLKVLKCSGCVSLLRLPRDLPNLTQLFCADCPNLILPKRLPSSVKFFDCSECTMKALPILSQNLIDLVCENCHSLTFLPKLPQSLISLDCTGSFIEYLPVLPENLEELLCMKTKILTLPELPETLTELECNRSVFAKYLSNLSHAFEMPPEEAWNCTDIYKRALKQLRVPAVIKLLKKYSYLADVKETEIIPAYKRCLQKYQEEIAPEIDEFISADDTHALGELVSEYVGFRRSRKGKKVLKTRKAKKSR